MRAQDEEFYASVRQRIEHLKKEEEKCAAVREALERALEVAQDLNPAPASPQQQKKRLQRSGGSGSAPSTSKEAAQPSPALVCEQCGGPKSKGSGTRCRTCYRARAAEKKQATLVRAGGPPLEPVPAVSPPPPSFGHTPTPSLRKKKLPTQADFLRAPVVVASADLVYPCYVCKERIVHGETFRQVNKTVVLHDVCVNGPPAIQPPARHITEAA